MVGHSWRLISCSAASFLADGCLSRGAAIAFYAVTSLGPVLLVIIAVAGVVYGEDAARGVLVERLSATMGEPSAAFLQSAVRSAWRHGSGATATVIGVVTLILSASGMFGEIQSALNVIFRSVPERTTVWHMVRDRLLSLLLVVGLAVVLVLSVVLGTAISAVEEEIDAVVHPTVPIWHGVEVLVSLGLLTGIIAAVYKILPDVDYHWHNIAVGALVTALLITVGKVLIANYIGRSGITSSYGAAGSVLAALLWIYYSAQIFLFGAEFTRCYADTREPSHSPAGSAKPTDPVSVTSDRSSPRAG